MKKENKEVMGSDIICKYLPHTKHPNQTEVGDFADAREQTWPGALPAATSDSLAGPKPRLAGRNHWASSSSLACTTKSA